MSRAFSSAFGCLPSLRSAPLDSNCGRFDVSEIWLFVAGVGITIPLAAGVAGLILLALADGRENDRHRAESSSAPKAD